MSKSILIIEDEISIAENLAYALGTDGFMPTHVSLGQQALSMLRQASITPALIVLDIGLPDINGFDVCRQLRQFSDTPVLFLTARNDEIDRIVGLEIGADDYVTKPFSPREVVARIRAILRRQQGNPQTNMGPAKRFELRQDEARILYYGHALNLTRYEYLLLKTLVERPGHLFSRAQLMEIVWTNAPETLERTVDAHIKSLRAKLRQTRLGSHDAADAQLTDSSDEGIQTHRGMGYSLSLA
ncbi:two-component system response regulator CreB [Undibacterium sp. Di26W]|uniref:two-component system response regulator CreB n=1 Tax=Undibacterium sp. Di26W TaxID=3413035 RepID=UPI003BEFD9E5